jgi:hypothetical protein
MSSSEPTGPPTESEVLVRDFLAANPSLDSELGGIETMTDRYTNEEWAKQIAETQKKVQVGGEKKGYGSVRVGSNEGLKELAQTVDHTVLKLDATSAQIDSLCSEARTEGFKVGYYLHIRHKGLKQDGKGGIACWNGSNDHPLCPVPHSQHCPILESPELFLIELSLISSRAFVSV